LFRSSSRCSPLAGDESSGDFLRTASAEQVSRTSVRLRGILLQDMAAGPAIEVDSEEETQERASGSNDAAQRASRKRGREQMETPTKKAEKAPKKVKVVAKKAPKKP